MESTYTTLLEKTRVPQASLQKFAVISIFSKLRTAATHSGPESDPGRDAISRCIHSPSPAVVNQSVRELCRLVSDSKLDVSIGLLELLSALEETQPKFVNLFVKGLGFLIRIGFERKHASFWFDSTQNHPFVKILLCRSDVQFELVNQVLLFMAENRMRMVEVCEFLKPFMNFCVLRISLSDSLSTLFARQLVSSMASICCSYPREAIPVFKLLMGCFKYLPRKNLDEVRNSYYFLECVVDAYIMVLRHLVQTGSGLVGEAQWLGFELSETIFSLSTCLHGSGGSEPFIGLVRHLLVVQKDLALKYRHEFSPKLLSLLFILVYSDLDHEQISVLKLLLFIFKWKSENEHEVDPTKFTLIDELLFTFPVISLMSSTSRLVKEAAADLLLILEKLLVQLLTVPTTEALEKRLPSVSTPGTITYRLLQDLWLQRASFFIELESVGETDVEGADGQLTNWASRLKVLTSSIVDRRKSSLTISQSQEMFLIEMLPLVGAVASVLVMHQSLGNSAVDLLAAIGNMDPKQGVPLLLAVLFYNNIFTKKDSNHQNMLPKLLAIIPSLASHNGMMPLVIQTILPMLQKDGKPLLYSTGTRLLCQTWEKNDRAFDSLQAVLLPEKFTEYRAERNICISLAACIRDVCRINPDRGVDLILSVSACINSQDPVIQSIGLQGLSHLCEADVIDFYTAWDVIAKHLLDYTESPALALSLCLLLRWGSLDAEAYSEASTSVLDILWKIGSSTHFDHIPGWPKARTSAFEALVHYELPSMERGIPDFKRKNTDLLLCETNEDVLKAMKEFQVKIIKHEHENRRRFVKEKKVAGTKIEKLLDVIPQVLFPAGKKSNAGRLPAAALLCLSFTPNDFKSQVLPRCPLDVRTAYECAMVEIAASVELSRNLVLALLSLQSWKSFMQRWMRANISSLDEKATSTALDKTSKAANDIMKSVIQFAEKSVPRSAENIALAIGALCLVLPHSAHTIKSTASNFLLNWLSQYEHECRQWSAAVSLGLISCCLHITDHKQKFENINGILEVLRDSKNSLVKGACGVGLGFSCQDLLTGVEAANKFESDKENYKVQELALLGKIVKALLLNTSQLSQASYEILDILPAWFDLIEGDVATNSTSALFLKTQDNSEDDIWGTAGLVLGLGSSIGALYRAGAVDVVVKVKDMIISWMPHVDSAVMKSGFSGEESEKALSVGSTLVLPTIVAFCWRVEIMREDELDHLVKSYSKLISELLLVKRSDSFFRSLMMASCIGAGNLLACISSGDVRIIEVEYIKGFLEMFRKCYLSPYPPIIRLGGMLGVVNAMGAGAGILVDGRNFLASITTNQEHKELSNIPSPLLSSTACETQFTTLIQEMFLIAQNLDDIQMQQNAAWAVSFLRTIFWSYGSLDLVSNNQKHVAGSGTAPLSFHEDSSVMKLTSWLLNLDYSGEGTARHINTIVTIFRCLSQAPRLPAVDWSSIVRRCMRYKGRASDVLHGNATLKTGILRLECLQFSIAQSNQSSHLLTFVDEISNLSRFRTLELNLQLSLLSHLPGLVKVFSGSRLEKLFNDIVEFLLSDSSYQSYSPEQKSMLRISCWEGLNQCLEESSLGLLPDVEKCMETMFCLLHTSESESDSRLDLFRQEWSKMVKCLGKAREDWLLDFLQVPLMNLTEKDDRQVVKKILTKAKLVKIGSVRFAELGKVKTNILNCRSHGIWNVLIEVVAAIQRADSSIKRQWLVDAVEISCVSSYPSTAMRFIGLLSGSFCKYMPLLTMDQTSVLSDLPVTLTSLLKESDWEDVAESVASNLLISTERLYYCVTLNLDDNNRLNTQPIDESEKDVVDLLLQVMHETCVHLIDYLPLEKRIQIANIRC